MTILERTNAAMVVIDLIEAEKDVPQETTILGKVETALRAGASIETVCIVLGVSPAYVSMVYANLQGPWAHRVPYARGSKKPAPTLSDYDRVRR